MEKTIYVVSAIDNNYAQHYGVMLVSLFKNKKKETMVELYLIHSHLSEDNIIKIQSIVTKYKSKISFISVDRNHYKNCIVNGHISDATYYRLSISDVIPRYLEKILYLDSDTVVMNDLTDLWNININNYFVGAVSYMADRDSCGHIKNLGIKELSAYFNAGVMLINLKKWRMLDMENVAFDYMRKNKDQLLCWDQDVLNALLYNRYLRIPEKYNYMTCQCHKNEAGAQTSIMHFDGPMKPWSYVSEDKYKKYYYKYLRRSPWKFYISTDLTFVNAKYKFLNRHKIMYKFLRKIKTYCRMLIYKNTGNIIKNK